jgi:K+-sensing histidine kinase KdpD
MDWSRDPELAAVHSTALIAEVLGNLIENASRHAVSRVVVTAGAGPAGPWIAIEDDGKGLQRPQDQQHSSGIRLDERGDGAGLVLPSCKTFSMPGVAASSGLVERDGRKATIAAKSNASADSG